MSDEKIICCGDPYGRNNDALLAGVMANKNNNDPMAMAAMMNGGLNNQWNNPFIYLVWMMFAQRMWGNGEWGNGQNAQNIEMQNQLQAIRTQMQDNQNSNLLMDAVKGNSVAIGQLASNLNCDYNALQQAICAVQAGVQQLAGQVGFSAERVINAVNMGDANVTQALQNCCCQTQQSILKMGYEQQLATVQQTGVLQNGQSNIAQTIASGFAQNGYQTQQQTCDILNAGNANTQKIIDTLNNHWNSELSLKNQDLKFEISQLKQNQYLSNIITGGCGCGCANT